MVENQDQNTDADEAAAPEQAAEASENTSESAEGVQDELKRIKDQLLRTAADFENFRKRAKRDVDEAERRGAENALRELLPVIDNLERATAATEDATSVDAVATGVQMVLKQFQDVAARLSLERVESVGARFDPAVHDAVQQHETEEHPPGSIIQEVVPGYKLKERLLRPALVVVARPPAKNPEPHGESSNEDESEAEPAAE